MKRVFILLMSLFAMMSASTGLKAQEITITLEPGWNWISYPNAEVMDVASALGGFAPMEGDQIKSRYTTSRYTRGRWGGGVTQLMPGWGYMYYSARSETIEFSFAQSSSTSVATAMPTDITATSAVVGGTVTVPEGSHVFLRGVCWGTEPSPDIDGDHTTEETGIGSFSNTLEGLNPNTTYYVRAYAVSDHGLAYGNELSFTTEADSGGGDHAYVDLGLPSGLLWATCNVGADNPEDYGDYFAWGETQPKDIYNWSTYQHCMGDYDMLTKYCTDPNYGYNGFYDDLTILFPEDDAATANWGNDWRMPTKEEWQELLDNTTHTWTIQNGVFGELFIASNGNSLFLPAAGSRNDSNLSGVGSQGRYWSSSSLYTDFYLDSAWGLDFYMGSLSRMHYYARYFGFTVRPVRSSWQNTSFIINVSANPTEGGTVTGGGTYQMGQLCFIIATPNEGYTFTNWTENGEVVSTDEVYFFAVEADRELVANFVAYVDLGLPSGLLWATCNVGADSPEDYGDYFAWGETQPKDIYDLSTYQYCMGSITTMTKYCNNSSYGYNGFTDDLTILLPEDDAATANWGSDWRIPTKEEWQELLDNTTCTWTTQNGVNGRLFTASNGNSLFLPAAGFRVNSNFYVAGSWGDYWSSSLYTDLPYDAWALDINSGNFDVGYYNRHRGHSVRPVRSASRN